MDHFCIALFFIRNELTTYYLPTLSNINNNNNNNNNNNGSFLYSAIHHNKRTHYLPTYPT